MTTVVSLVSVHHLRPRLAQCQFKVTGWGIMFICGIVLRCTDTQTRFEPGPVTADLTTTVIHSYNLLVNNVKHVHSLTVERCTYTYFHEPEV